MIKAIQFVLFVLIAYFVIPCFLSGCPEAKVACQVIKLANTTCMFIEYVGEDGKTHQVPVTPQELEGLAKANAARRDAGAK